LDDFKSRGLARPKLHTQNTIARSKLR